jgi:phage terminase large subunit GpA-like protein
MPASLTRYAFDFWKYQKPRSVVEWASQELELSDRITEQSGPFSTRLYPYVDEILETVRDPNIRRVSLCWGSQTSKTTSFYVMLGYCIDQRPQPILWVFPNYGLCHAFAKDRWLPFCKESRGLVKHLPTYSDGTVNRDDFTLTKQEFSRCTMNLVGAGSSANVRSYPISLLVLDEIDVIAESTRRECMDRVKGRQDYKILQSSTPVRVDGGIWQEFQQSDRRRYWVPCPHCGERILFKWEGGEGEINLKWDEDARGADGEFDLDLVLKTAFYRCEKCEGKIEDKHKLKMLREGKWVAANSKAESGSRSYHLNSFYSPTITFGRMATEFLRAQRTVGGMKTFVEGWLAEPWRADSYGLINPDAFRKLEGEYERGTIMGDYRVIGCDVQRDYFVWVVRGFDKDGHSYLIDNGMAPNFEDVNEISKNYEVNYGIVDTGYRTQEMYEEIYKRRPFWFGAKAWDKLQTSYRLSKINPFHHNQLTTKSRATVNIVHVNKDTWGQELLKHRSGETMRWELYQGVDTEYIRQMLSTNLVENVNRMGKAVMEWKVEGHKQDHYWDCEQYLLALSHLFGLGRANTRGEKKPTPKKPSTTGGGGFSDDSFWG